MKYSKFEIFSLIFVVFLIGCKQPSEPKKSAFKVAQHYKEFTSKMENNDTLNILAILSMCMWEEYDYLQITKTNDSIFIQVLEKYVRDD